MRARAIIEGWHVPLEDRPGIVRELVDAVKLSDNIREKISAAKALLSIPDKEINAARLQIEQERWAKEKKEGDTSNSLAELLRAAAEHDKRHGDTDAAASE